MIYISVFMRSFTRCCIKRETFNSAIISCKVRRNQKTKYLEGCRISWNIPMFVVHRWNIQSGKVQIYAATEFFKSHSTEMGVDMQIDRASIHLLSPSTTSPQPESSHQQEFEWNNVKLWTNHVKVTIEWRFVFTGNLLFLRFDFTYWHRRCS